MTRKNDSDNAEVERFIAQLPVALRDIAECVRTQIRSNAPELLEQFKWNRPVYVRKRHVCYIAAAKDHVKLGFEDGAKLKDPDQVLEGTGASMRHVKLTSLADANAKGIASLIRRAAQLDAERG